MIESGKVYRLIEGVTSEIVSGARVTKATGHDYGCAGEDTRLTGVEHVSVEVEGSGGPFFTTPVANLEPVETTEADAEARKLVEGMHARASEETRAAAEEFLDVLGTEVVSMDPTNPAATVPIEIVVEGADEEEGEESTTITPIEPTISLASDATVAEPRPIGGTGEPVFDEVIADMEARKAYGIHTYGEPLRTFNGRRMLVDAYQEAIDLALFVKGEIMERRAIARRLASAEAEIEALAAQRDGMREMAITAARSNGALRSAIVALAVRNAEACVRAGYETGAGGARETAIRSTIADDLRKILDGRDGEFVISRSVRAYVAELQGEIDTPAPPSLATETKKRAVRRLSAILAGGEEVPS